MSAILTGRLTDAAGRDAARPGVPRRPGVMERLEKIESKIDKQREENCYERTQRTG